MNLQVLYTSRHCRIRLSLEAACRLPLINYIRLHPIRSQVSLFRQRMLSPARQLTLRPPFGRTPGLAPFRVRKWPSFGASSWKQCSRQRARRGPFQPWDELRPPLRSDQNLKPQAKHVAVLVTNLGVSAESAWCQG